MRYLFLLYGPDEPLPGPETPEGQTMIGEWRTATEAMAELIEAMRLGTDDRTPPLAEATSGPARTREFLTGIGGRP